MRIILILIFFVFIYSPMKSQEVVINESPVIKSALENFEVANREETSIKGWKIQIVTTADRRESENAKRKFQNIYPNIPVHWEHKSPYYVVRVGAYEKKIDLMSFLYELKKQFPAATPVVDDIRKIDLIK